MSNEGLRSLFEKYCKSKNWEIVEKDGHGRKSIFTFFIFDHSSERELAVKILDWNRSVGVDQAIRLQKACEDQNYIGILVTNMLSRSAESMCLNHGLITLTR